ncbi:sodium:proton antiporter [bacterium 0.1xD8-71]|nr:sodium:proton antiporter [bacterium 0.1xD8-71]
MIYHTIYITMLILLSFMLLACLIRAVRGPLIADRLMAVNMMGTMVMVMIAVLALMLKEGYLIDICLIYAMISFLAVVVLSKVYIGIYEEKHHKKDSDNDHTVKGDLSDGNA